MGGETPAPPPQQQQPKGQLAGGRAGGGGGGGKEEASKSGAKQAAQQAQYAQQARGKAGKDKKAKQRYADQDAEERALAMQVLQSAGASAQPCSYPCHLPPSRCGTMLLGGTRRGHLVPSQRMAC